jgi:hypothetical protein
MSPKKAAEKTNNLLPTPSVDSLLQQDPDDISWLEIECLDSADDSQRVWDHVRVAKQEELELGATAAKVIESYHSNPAERAEFFAIRQALVDGWKPEGGLELMLIDTLACDFYMHRFWLQLHVERVSTRAAIQKSDLEKRGEWRQPYSYEAEATIRAAEMAESFHRSAMRTLRSLRDLRRYVPAVSIRNAGQVNISEKQVNLTAPQTVEP